jgi:hypothetical protein
MAKKSGKEAAPTSPKKPKTTKPKLPPPEPKSPWEQPWATFVKLGASVIAGAVAIASLKTLSKRSKQNADDEN